MTPSTPYNDGGASNDVSYAQVPSLISLPFDAYLLIVQLLDVRDVVALSLCSRSTYNTLNSNRSIWHGVVKRLLRERHIVPYSFDLPSLTLGELRHLASKETRLENRLRNVASGESIECQPLTADSMFKLTFPDDAFAVSVALLPGGRWLYGSAMDPEEQRLVVMCWDMGALSLLGPDPDVPTLNPVASISSRDLVNPRDIDGLRDETEFGSWQSRTLCYQYDPENQTINHLFGHPVWQENEPGPEEDSDDDDGGDHRPTGYVLEVIQMIWDDAGAPSFHQAASIELSEQLPQEVSLERMVDTQFDIQGNLAFLQLGSQMVVWDWVKGVIGMIAAGAVHGTAKYLQHQDQLIEYTIDFFRMAPLTANTLPKLKIFILHFEFHQSWTNEIDSCRLFVYPHLPRDRSPLGLIASSDKGEKLIPYTVCDFSNRKYRTFYQVLMTRSSSLSFSIRHQFHDHPAQIFFCTAQHLLTYSEHRYSTSLGLPDMTGWTYPMSLPLMDSPPRQNDTDLDKEIFLNIPLSPQCSLVDPKKENIHIHNICPMSGTGLAEVEVDYEDGDLDPVDRLFMLTKLTP
ncbi:hypothetical protein DL93DRAFT_2173011 [Clavulina sp. PMI_390]|nr:hypothetical protein DL93DRAFT_2173011 [Clavulina sp. PMI_390]